jgi:hypothetical protein
MKRGPRRTIIGEFLHSDGDLYAILRCGHAVIGNYNKDDGMPTTTTRNCGICGKIKPILLKIRGFLEDSDTAIRQGKNLILWAKLPPRFDDMEYDYEA